MAGITHRLGYARSLLITAPLIFFYTGVMGALSVASSLVDSTGRLQHGCARVWARLILWTARVRVRVEGMENLAPRGPFVLCVNHQSHMDIPILLAALPFQFCFAAKKELFRIPFLGWHLRRSGHIPIDRTNPHSAVKAMRDAAQKLRAGTPLLIFPEGGTSRDGVIKPFKGGGFVLATQAAAPLIPVTVRGARKILVPGTYYVRGGLVEVVAGPPISSVGARASELAGRVRDEIVQRFENAKAGEALDRHSHALSRS